MNTLKTLGLVALLFCLSAATLRAEETNDEQTVISSEIKGQLIEALKALVPPPQQRARNAEGETSAPSFLANYAEDGRILWTPTKNSYNEWLDLLHNAESAKLMGNDSNPSLMWNAKGVNYTGIPTMEYWAGDQITLDAEWTNMVLFKPFNGIDPASKLDKYCFVIIINKNGGIWIGSLTGPWGSGLYGHHDADIPAGNSNIPYDMGNDDGDKIRLLSLTHQGGPDDITALVVNVYTEQGKGELSCPLYRGPNGEHGWKFWQVSVVTLKKGPNPKDASVIDNKPITVEQGTSRTIHADADVDVDTAYENAVPAGLTVTTSNGDINITVAADCTTGQKEIYFKYLANGLERTFGMIINVIAAGTADKTAPSIDLTAAVAGNITLLDAETIQTEKGSTYISFSMDETVSKITNCPTGVVDYIIEGAKITLQLTGTADDEDTQTFYVSDASGNLRTITLRTVDSTIVVDPNAFEVAETEVEYDLKGTSPRIYVSRNDLDSMTFVGTTKIWVINTYYPNLDTASNAKYPFYLNLGKSDGIENGTYTLNFTKGTKTVSVKVVVKNKVVDTDGNINNIPPTINSFTPGVTAKIAQGLRQRMRITATSSDKPIEEVRITSPSGIKAAYVNANGNFNADMTTSTPITSTTMSGAWELLPYLTEQGLYSATVVAGGKETSQTFEVTFPSADDGNNGNASDTTGPTLTISTPVAAGGTYETSNPSLLIAGTSADSESNVELVSISYAGPENGSLTVNGTTSWNAVMNFTTTGTYTFTVTSQDYSVAENKTTGTFTVIYTMVDTVAPGLALVTPASGSVTTTTGTTNITVRATDNVAVRSVKCVLSGTTTGTFWFTQDATDPLNWNITLTVNDAVTTATITAYDGVIGSGNASIPVYVTITGNSGATGPSGTPVSILNPNKLTDTDGVINGNINATGATNTFRSTMSVYDGSTPPVAIARDGSGNSLQIDYSSLFHNAATNANEPVDPVQRVTMPDAASLQTVLYFFRDGTAAGSYMEFSWTVVGYGITVVERITYDPTQPNSRAHTVRMVDTKTQSGLGIGGGVGSK